VHRAVKSPAEQWTGGGDGRPTVLYLWTDEMNHENSKTWKDGCDQKDLRCSSEIKPKLQKKQNTVLVEHPN